MCNYLINRNVAFDCGFDLNVDMVVNAIHNTNAILGELPPSFFVTIDYKTTSAAIGCILCQSIADQTNGQAIVNPIEKGHPDIVPSIASGCTEEELRNYPQGLEIKCTVGSAVTGAKIPKARPRIAFTSSLVWQAHHQEVAELLGVTYDYASTDNGYKPIITGVFYSSELVRDDWGNISGTTGRNTKVSSMKKSGIVKMGEGWIAVLDNEDYINKYQKLLGFKVG